MSEEGKMVGRGEERMDEGEVVRSECKLWERM
jgi:hypothetical protein